MQTSVSFTSNKFRPFLPDDCQVNPGRYGAELAYWLSEELAKRGVITSYPNFEDWGWFIEYITASGDEFWLCCGNVDGSQNSWRCFLEPKGKGFFNRKTPAADEAAILLTTLNTVLEGESSVSGIVWEESK